MSSIVVCRKWDNALLFTHFMNEMIGWPLDNNADYIVDEVMHFQWIEETQTGIVLFKVHEFEEV